MTITSSTNKNQYTSTGETTFSYTFKIFTDSEIKVVVTDQTSLVDGTKTLTTDYTVTGVGNAAGGTVVFNSATTSGDIVTLVRDTEFTQDIDYVENDTFPASSHEEAIDRAVMRDQQINETIGRSIRVSEGTLSSFSTLLPNPSGNGNKYLKLNSTATGVDYTSNLDTSGATAYMETLLDDPDAATARSTLGLGALATQDSVSPFSSGMLLPFAGASSPSGWLLCYGQAISRTTYSDLFTAIGTTYGSGDGSTTFNVPDLRGRVIAGQDDMGGTSANRLTDQSGGLNGDTLGDTGGSETHTLTESEMPSHTHSTPGSCFSGHAEPLNLGSGADGHVLTTGTTGSAGSGAAHNNVQPTIILNYIIKT